MSLSSILGPMLRFGWKGIPRTSHLAMDETSKGDSMPDSTITYFRQNVPFVRGVYCAVTTKPSDD
jgi:hypothetical protein